MMIGLFFLMLITAILLYLGLRKWGIAMLLSTLVLMSFMLWYHATTALQINW